MLKRLMKFLTRPNNGREYWFYVRCGRCGEVIKGRIDMLNDLSLQYPENGGDDHYFTRKVLMGSNRCFQRIETEFTFDLNRNLTGKEITGGTFITEEEYGD